MTLLPRALVDRLGPERIRIAASGRSIVEDGSRFVVSTDGDLGEVPAEAVVLATPAFVSASVRERSGRGGRAGDQAPEGQRDGQQQRPRSHRIK